MGVATMTINKYQACIYECNRCAQACYECFKACLNEPDVADRKNCMSILVECAKVCEMSSTLLSMNTEFAKDYCNLCAVVCDKCAEECEKFKDEHCQKCAHECGTCADECSRMGGMY
ncbi:ferredoxin [Clostridium polyendosporum]|uniref:Ferredoxin n=1 Tax=Clostridium polyendosporum TaxID=69208 RepID=A0A919VHZ0_9CLOT|nr:four-helix bundle copper-binding protein [Clostridium polyendosporum]GIM30722.1 ferredoxin [Clostridium polyendosporum]